MMPDDKHFLTWDDVEHLCVRLAAQISDRGQEYDVILGIARGGTIPATLLSQVLKHGMIETAHLRRYDDQKTFSEAMPKVIAFPDRTTIHDRRILIVDEVYDHGHSIIRVKQEVMTCDPKLVHTAVLHFKPERNQYEAFRPNYFVEETDDWIVYPWETFAEKVAAHQLM